ncbi:glycoside hydrolase family 32 protein [Neolewinella agarilytica]|nr:glycoside hydrolase family 32 protein [Neolewinella agarilytica]
MITESDANMEYLDSHRPQIHFSPQEKWMNDPNGMVFYDGEYHLFYQYYPDSTVWGPMHWGHAVSEDMVHWEHLPIALYPDSLGWIFSGSAVYDEKNTSGLGEDGNGPLIAIFTYHNSEMEKAGRQDFQYQGIAYSNDRGRTWKKYAGNPVVPNTESIRDFRDPKVSWDAEREQWLMVFAAQNRMMFWSSPNLIDWTFESEFGQEFGSHGGVWECPDFFPASVEGEGITKWILIASINPGGPNGGSATQYFVGDWDGKTFTLDEDFRKEVTNEQAVWLDYGRDNYAGVTWSNIPETDGRRLFIGWMSNWQYARDVPTEAWRSAMTVARKLELHRLSSGYRIFSTPVKELKQLRTSENMLNGDVVSATMPLKAFIAPASAPITDRSKGTYELELEFTLLDKEKAGSFGVILHNSSGESYRVGYDPSEDEFFSDRTKSGDTSFSDKFADKITIAPRNADAETIRMQLVFDQASAELFADGGATVITDIFFPDQVFNQISLFSETENTVKLSAGKAYALKRIWDAGINK